jgi:hypothetical protein
MKIRPAVVAAAVFGLLTGAAASAQTIQFQHYFNCNGERVAVDSCFDDSDNAHCMVMYPDRPLHNGFEVQITELRSDVIKTIQSCVGPAATLASTGNPGPASPAPGTAAAPRPAAAAPAAAPAPPDPSVAIAHAARVDTTVFGISLGEAFTLPHCVRGNDLVSQVDGMMNGDVDPAGLLDQNQPTPCYGANPTELQNGQAYAWMPVDTVIKFSDDKCASWLSGCVAYGMLRNGLLLAMYMDPENGTGPDVTAQQLTAKYGKPSATQNVTVQNSYGNSVQVTELFWELPGLHVEYSPLIAQTQRGMLRIETETAYQIRLAAQKAIEDKQPKL